MLLATVTAVWLLACLIDVTSIKVPTPNYIPTSQMDALYDLFESTLGAYWSWRPESEAGSKWYSNIEIISPCQQKWQGVNCSYACFSNVSSVHSHCTIKSLELSRYNLSGTLPLSIGNLTGLEILDLSDNRLSGTLPVTIGRLSLLQSLSLGALLSPIIDELTALGIQYYGLIDFESLDIQEILGPNVTFNISDFTDYNISNQLTGTIPSAIGKLANLESLNLNHNKLGGTLPIELYDLSKLAFLDLDANLFTGSISHKVGNLANCQVFSLLFNAISGSIPAELGNMTSLAFLGLSFNNIEGTIPSEIGKMTTLEVLALEINSLSGWIPSELGLLTNVVFVTIGVNQFSGTLPSALGNMQNMSLLGIEYNSFSGTIPTELCNLYELGILLIDFNVLEGTICENFSNLANIRAVVGTYNILTGTIPESMFTLKHLVNINWSYNYFNGSLPNSIGSLSTLKNCTNEAINATIAVKGLSYTIEIPSDQKAVVVNFVSFLGLAANLFSGTIPNEITQLSCLSYILLYLNSLEGSLPQEIGNMLPLTTFVADENALTGVIPESIGKLVHLKQITLNNNQLTGTIPSAFASLLKLVSVTADNNYLTGPIPDIFEDCRDLQTFSIYSNKLSGTIPASIAKASKLGSFLIGNNRFSGNIEYFAMAYQENSLSVLKSVDISNNRFTGTISSELFLLPSLTSISLVKNCFRGSIAETICQMQHISSLNLNGLTTGDACEIPLIAFLHTYTTNFMTGTIPTCLFSLSTLVSLEIAGNGLLGTLPNLLRIPDRLLNIAASYNRIQGTIPNSFASGTLAKLDLRSNELSGTAEHLGTFYANYYERNLSEIQPQLILSENRLSGNIPPAFVSASSINVLSGNMFGCATKSELPSNDPAYLDTGCGTNFLNFTLILYFVLLAAIAVSMAVMWLPKEKLLNLKDSVSSIINEFDRRLRPSANSFASRDTMDSGEITGADLLEEAASIAADDADTWDSINSTLNTIVQNRFNEVSLAENSYCMHLLQGVRVRAALVCLIIVFVLLPLFVILKKAGHGAYSTHVFQYALNPSIAFLKGSVPAIFMCVLLMIVSTTAFYFLNSFNRALQIIVNNVIRSSKNLSWKSIRSIYSGDVDSILSSQSSNDLRAISRSHLQSSLSSVSQIARQLSSKRTKSSFPTANTTTAPSTVWMICSDFFAKNSIAIKNIAFILVDVIAISVVNGAFVYIILTQNEYAVYVAEFALASIKVSWNNVVVPAVLSRINNIESNRMTYFSNLESSIIGSISNNISSSSDSNLNISTNSSSNSNNSNSTSTGATSMWAKRSTRIDIQVYLNIFNVLISPLLCLLVDGSNCFLHTFVQNESIKNTSIYQTCHVTAISGKCVDIPREISTVFVPPFIYTYQCSSQFVRNYVAVFVIMYIYLAIVSPLIHLYIGFQAIQVPSDSSTTLIVRLQSALTSEQFMQSRVPFVKPKQISIERTGSYLKGFHRLNSFAHSFSNAFTGTSLFSYLSQRCTKIDRYICKLIVDLSVLLTFGIAYPALGIIICISVICSSYEFHLLLSRCCQVYDQCKEFRLQPFPKIKCEGIIDILLRIRWVIIAIMCWFFAFFLYDISLGDYSTGMWTSVVMLLWPFVLYAINWYQSKYFKVDIKSDITTTNIELANMAASRPASARLNHVWISKSASTIGEISPTKAPTSTNATNSVAPSNGNVNRAQLQVEEEGTVHIYDDFNSDFAANYSLTINPLQQLMKSRSAAANIDRCEEEIDGDGEVDTMDGSTIQDTIQDTAVEVTTIEDTTEESVAKEREAERH